MTYADQLMEIKRKSRLSGRPVATATTAALNSDYQSGAKGRISTGNQLGASSALQDQMKAYSQMLVEQRAGQNTAANQQAAAYRTMLEQQAAAMAAMQGAYQPVDFSGFEAMIKAYNDDIAAMQYKMQFPYSQTLQPDNPQLSGTPIEKPEPTGGTPTLVPPGNDTAASMPWLQSGLDPRYHWSFQYVRDPNNPQAWIKNPYFNVDSGLDSD